MDSMYGVIRSLHMYIDTVWTVVVKYDFFKFKIVTKPTYGDIAKGPWDTEIEPSLIFMFLFLLRYESSSLKLYKELSSSIFQNCQSVSQSVCQACVTPFQISTLCNI